MRPDYDRAARLAYKTLAALNVCTLPVDPRQILSYCKNTYVHTYSEAMDLFGRRDRTAFKYDVMGGHDAMTFCQDVGGHVVYELVYDDHAHILRRRFTLAHELGHIILRHGLEEPHEEQEADCFAGQLLAPQPVLCMFRELGVDVTEPFVRTVFRLSASAARAALSARPRNVGSDQVELIRRLFGPCVMDIVAAAAS